MNYSIIYKILYGTTKTAKRILASCSQTCLRTDRVMILDKEFETQIDLKSPTELYGDLDLIVKQKLEDEFVGRCYYGSLILKIKDILERPPCQITDTANTGYGYISVRFIAEVYMVYINDLVIGQVLKIEDNRLECIDERSAMLLRRVPAIKGIKTGQYIPICVKRAAYTVSRPKLSINGAFYLISKASDVYKIGELTKDDKLTLEPFLEKINEAKKLLDKAEIKSVKFFTTLLYPFEKEQKVAKTKNMLKMDISGIITRSTINRYEPLVCTESDSENIIEQPAVVVYQILFSEYIQYLNALVLLCQTYNTDAIRKENSNLWDIYLAYKKVVITEKTINDTKDESDEKNSDKSEKSDLSDLSESEDNSKKSKKTGSKKKK